MLKELSKKAVVTSGEDLPRTYFRYGGAATELRRLFTKNTALCKLARGSIEGDACPVLEDHGEECKLRT